MGRLIEKFTQAELLLPPVALIVSYDVMLKDAEWFDSLRVIDNVCGRDSVYIISLFFVHYIITVISSSFLVPKVPISFGSMNTSGIFH